MDYLPLFKGSSSIWLKTWISEVSSIETILVWDHFDGSVKDAGLLSTPMTVLGPWSMFFQR